MRFRGASTIALGAVLLAAASMAACATLPETVDAERSSSGAVSALPDPGNLSDARLVDVLGQRRSTRTFGPQPLNDSALSALLWAAQGVTSEWGGRTAPSAGALYPLELYVLTADAVWHYLPHGHRIEILPLSGARPAVEEAIGQEAAASAAALVVITAVPERVAPKYGGRAERYIALEAGHTAQNLLLAATALGLAGVPMGAFADRAIAEALGLPSAQEVIYTVAVGHPASASTER
ncbi:MAG: SagB/ThcOx family dehydrogenase [Actinomycetales bacterium]|nr:SagB/ThcOx family dehydrogenase [Actinomycetales bacterium]